MRSHLAFLITLTACGSSGREYVPTLTPAEIEKLEKKLEPSMLELMARGRPDRPDLAFPVQKVVGKCGDESVEVVYDPYRDVVSASFMQEAALSIGARTLTMEGKRVWKADRPFQGSDQLFMVTGADGKTTVSKGGTWLEDVSKKHAKMFRPDADVELDFEATAMIAHQYSSSEFRWDAHTFRGWRMKLHVLSADMIKSIREHKEAVKRTDDALSVLRGYTSEFDVVRRSKEPRVIAAVKRYDELLAAAEKAHEAVKAIPFPQYVSTLAVEKSPCTL